VKIREVRAADAPRILEFIQKYFPEEEALMGTRPEGFRRMVHRIFRWDTRFLLGLLRLFGRPVFNYFVIEEDGQLVASTMLTYEGPSGYISMVVVDPAHRRHGFAQQLLERARATSERRGKQFVALDVLAHNAPAIALYERLGYRRLRSSGFMVLDSTDALVQRPEPISPSIRPFRPSDADALVRIVRAANPAEVEKVLPTRPGELRGSSLIDRVLEADVAGWVIDRGNGPEGWIRASVSQMSEAANVSRPIVAPTVEPALAVALVRTAGSWCAARRPGRVLSMITEENRLGRAALEGAGFHEALAAYTLYRPVA
jgi:ribosomal protein S18 acetylase RimI-like enzyme